MSVLGFCVMRLLVLVSGLLKIDCVGVFLVCFG